MVPCTCSASFGFIPSSISLFLCHCLTPLHLNPSLPLQQGSYRHQYHSHMAVTAWSATLPTSASHIISITCYCAVFLLLFVCLGFYLAFIFSLHHGNLSLLVDRHQVFFFHSSSIQSISLLHLCLTPLWSWVKPNFLHIDWYGAVFPHHANLF